MINLPKMSYEENHNISCVDSVLGGKSDEDSEESVVLTEEYTDTSRVERYCDQVSRRDPTQLKFALDLLSQDKSMCYTYLDQF